MRRLVFVAFLLVMSLSVAPLLAQEPEKPGEPAGDAVKWESSFDSAMEKAKKDDLMIMVYIYVEGSSMAADFEKFAINQPAVVDLSRKFLCVKVEKNKNKDIVKSLGAGSATRVLFLNSEKKRLGEVRGYDDPGPFAKKVKDVYESIEIEKKAREKLGKDSEDLEANLALAKVWVIRNYVDQAMALFQKVVDGDARNKEGLLVEAAFRLGHLQFEGGQFKQARDNFKKVRKYDVSDSEGYGDDRLLAEARMDLALRLAHREVRRRQIGDLHGMGSTLVALLIRHGRALVGHAGDSRIYRLRDGKLKQLTRDHSFYADLVAAGVDDLPERGDFRFNNLITCAVGMDGPFKPHVSSEIIQEYDRYLLCSDGLTDVVSDTAIATILQDLPPKEASPMLVAEALTAGARDNVTALVVEATTGSPSVDDT